MTRFFIFILLLFTSCKTTTYYIVRHAEKEAGTAMTATTNTSMTSDVPLSTAGSERVEALKNMLINKNIKQIFSTNTLRTTSTAKPLSTSINVPIEFYNAVDTTFLSKLKAVDKGNILVVGHSNTVDDLVNGLMGQKQLSDLTDDQFGDLFIVKKKGARYSYIKQHFGK